MENSVIKRLRIVSKDLVPDFNGTIRETKELSHCVNKKDIYINLGYTYHTILFIFIHELSHTQVNELDHGPEFLNKNTELLGLAAAKGLLPLNFQAVVSEIETQKDPKKDIPIKKSSKISHEIQKTSSQKDVNESSRIRYRSLESRTKGGINRRR